MSFMSPRKFALVVMVAFAQLPTASAESAKRFVITAEDPDSVRTEVEAEGGEHSHDLRYRKGFVAKMSPSAAKKLRESLAGVARIEEDAQMSIMGRPSGGGTPPAESIPWGITAVKATEANLVTRGAGVTVCVVDTGIQKDHPDLVGNILGGENFVVIKGTIDPTKFDDDNGHGTHVSGTIAAVDNSIGVIGVAPDARIFAVKALDRRGSGYLSDIADGILSCVANGAQVINLSLGGSYDATVLHDAVRTAAALGVAVIAAAGNDGTTTVSYPARYAEAIAVTAVDSGMRFASFSNSGPEVDFAAPGVRVYSTAKGSSYTTYDGTSMATPHAAGVFALKVASGSLGVLADDIGLSSSKQGAGFVNALRTVNNIAIP